MATYKPRIELLKENGMYYPYLGQQLEIAPPAEDERILPCETRDLAINDLRRRFEMLFEMGDIIIVNGTQYTTVTAALEVLRAAAP